MNLTENDQIFAEVNPNNFKVEASFSNDAFDACFKPYRALLNLHTTLSPPCSKPGGWSIKTSSLRLPLRNALLK